MVSIVNETDWHGFKLQNVRIKASEVSDVSCSILWPNVSNYPVPVILAMHGATSSKHEWTEYDGYTKGGNVSVKLLHAGIAIIAMDRHYHGDNDTADLQGRNVFEKEEYFEDFFERSIVDVKTVLKYIDGNSLFDKNRIGFSGYSLAGMFGFWLANNGVPFKMMVLCVPGVKRDENKYYSSYNNLQNVTKPAVLQISAENDEYIAFNDAKWLF